MDKSFNKVIKSHVMLAFFSAIAVVLMASGVSYSLFQIDKKNTTNQTVSVGTLSGDLTSITGAIVVNDLYPQSASEITEDGKKYEFTISNTGTYDLDYTIYLKDATETLLATTTEYASYKRIAENHYQYINYKLDGKNVYNLTTNQSGDKFIVIRGTLRAGQSEDHYLQFFLDNQDTTTTGAPNEIAGSVLSLDIYLDAGIHEQTAIDKIALSSNGIRTNFDEPATTDEGVFEMEDDYGTSYYYRGAVTNNYVQFAGFYWRIIRINGDGSLRIVYDGTQAYANGADSSARFIGTSAYNTNYDDIKYVGYMYGPAGTTASTSATQAQTNTVDSTIKTYIDNWYKTNIVDEGYSNAVADTLFCNDRTTPGSSITGWSSDTGLGYGKNATAFGAMARTGVWNSSTTPSAPTFKCAQKNDAFTVSDTVKGNGSLTYPIGLITADEIVAAGSGKFNTTNTSYYLYHPSNWWWTLSSSSYNGSAIVSTVHSSGSSYASYVGNTEGAVAPVINLSAEYVNTLRGSGTTTDPYTAA